MFCMCFAAAFLEIKKKKSALIISIHVLIEVLQLNGSHQSARQLPLRACPPREGNSTSSPRLAGGLQLFFKHKPQSMPHAPTGMHGPLRAFHASHCLHCGTLAYQAAQPPALRSN